MITMKRMLLGLMMVSVSWQMMAPGVHAAEATTASKVKTEVTAAVAQTDELLKESGDPDVADPTASALSAVQTQQGKAADVKLASTVASVNLRASASTSGKVLRLLPKGEKVTVLGQYNSNWYHVQDSKGNAGYMSTSSKYIKVDGSVATPAPTPDSKPDAGTSPSKTVNEQIEKVISTGMKYMGTPYEFGSNRSTTTTFDCSDFVRQAYKEALGIVLPTDSRKQGTWIRNNSTVKKSISSLKRGDLMFFMTYKGSKPANYAGVNKDTERITHVGIYLGDNKILQTYSVKSGGVRIDTVSNNTWEYRFLFGGSILK